MVIPQEILSAKKTIVPKGEVLLRQGQQCTHYLFVREGIIKVYSRSAHGKETVLYKIHPNEMCVLTTSCLLSSSHFPAEAMAETEVLINIIDRAQFHSLLNTSAEFRAFAFFNFGERLNDLIIKFEHLNSDSVDSRLIKCLLDHVNTENIVLLRHQDIATHIGSVREVVSRNLKALEKKGLIKLYRGKIEVLKTQQLNTLIS